MESLLSGNIVEANIGGKPTFYYTFLPHKLVTLYGLKPSIIAGTLDQPDQKNKSLDEIIKSSFIENPSFITMLSDFFSEASSKNKDIINEAEKQKDGWIYIIDQRTPTPNADVPPCDIVGGVEVQGGKITNFKMNPNYRIYSENGFINLGPNLNQALNRHMQKILLDSKQS